MTPDQTPAVSDQHPKFQLPQRSPRRSGGSAAGKLACVLLVVVIGLQVYDLVRSDAALPAAAPEARGPIPSDDLQATAMKLEDRNLASAGAEAWRQYLDRTSLEPLEQARILYRIGKLLLQTEQFEYAVANFYLAERLAGAADDDLSRRINMRVRECLQRMGRYSELTREMADRAAAESGADASLAGRQVVAQIGDDKITVADFERMVQTELDREIAARPGLTPEQADEAHREMSRQLAEPQAKAQFLHQMVASRVLAAEAKQAQLDQSPDYRERLVTFADNLLASMLMTELIATRAVVTPEDAQRFYQANQEDYAEPARLNLAHIVLASEQEARDLLARALGGADFGELAEQFSTDQRTKKNGGRIAQPLTKDASAVAGIGRHPELQAALWAVAAGDVLNDVYQTDAGWHVVRVAERTERVQKSYAEVKDRVERDAREARQREVSRQYLQELFDQHEAKLYPEAFLMSPKESGEASDK